MSRCSGPCVLKSRGASSRPPSGGVHHPCGRSGARPERRDEADPGHRLHPRRVPPLEVLEIFRVEGRVGNPAGTVPWFDEAGRSPVALTRGRGSSCRPPGGFATEPGQPSRLPRLPPQAQTQTRARAVCAERLGVGYRLGQPPKRDACAAQSQLMPNSDDAAA